MRKFILLFLMMLLASCVQVPWRTQAAFTCEQIAWLQQQIGITTSSDAIRNSIRTAFSLPPEAILVRSVDGEVVSGDETSFVRWLDQRKLAYDIDLDANGQIIRIDIFHMSIVGDQLLACLGQPAQYYSYAAWEENGPHHRLHLFFPEQGIRAYGADRWRGAYKDPIPAIDGKFPIYDLMIVRPQSVEAMTHTGWGDFGPKVLNECKPWPGAWERIEFAYKSSLEQ